MNCNSTLENIVTTPNEVIAKQLDIYFPLYDLHLFLEKQSSVKN